MHAAGYDSMVCAIVVGRFHETVVESLTARNPPYVAPNGATAFSSSSGLNVEGTLSTAASAATPAACCNSWSSTFSLVLGSLIGARSGPLSTLSLTGASSTGAVGGTLS